MICETLFPRSFHPRRRAPLVKQSSEHKPMPLSVPMHIPLEEIPFHYFLLRGGGLPENRVEGDKTPSLIFCKIFPETLLRGGIGIVPQVLRPRIDGHGKREPVLFTEIPQKKHMSLCQF